MSLGALVVREMHVLYGSRFAQQWGGLTPRELRESWDKHLEGMTEQEVRAGLVACLSREWPPSLPEFLRLCRPWLNPETAFYEAVSGTGARQRGEMGEWSHPSIYWAAVATGTHDLLHASYSVLKARWERAFGEQLAKGAWEEVPPVRQALPAPGKTEATREEAEMALRKLGALDVLRPPADQKAWAVKILEEQQRPGGRRYSRAVTQMACRALGIAEGA